MKQEQLKQKVLICAVVKNVAAQIQKNIALAIKTGQYFSNYHIILYENNSSDRTKKILETIQKPHLSIISEDISEYHIKQLRLTHNDTLDGKVTRIEQICFARNRVLQEINKEAYDDFTHVIWIDMDSAGWSIKGILDSFRTQHIWNVVYANSYPKYYDYYALRIQHNSIFNIGPEIIGEQWWRELNDMSLQFHKKQNINTQEKICTPFIKYEIPVEEKNGTFRFITKKNISIDEVQIESQEKSEAHTEKNYGLLPVLSAFNGIGIFKKHIFKQFKYHYLITEDIKHIYRHFIHPKVYAQFSHEIEQYNNSSTLEGEKDAKSTIVWKYHYGKPLVCEHVALNFSLIRHGFKLYINPNMTYKQYISLRTRIYDIGKLLRVILKKLVLFVKHIITTLPFRNMKK